MQKAFTGLDISFDHYSRTSSPKHHEVAQDFFLTLLDKGGFEVKTEEQFYDEEAKQFLADRYIQGTCPSCGHDGAYGDQCEKCGKTLSPTELVNPRSTLSGSTPVLKPTTLWYLPMGRHEDWLREYIVDGTLDGHPHHNAKEWKAHVLGQCRSWIDGGLESRAMTRDLDWGVPVPVEGAEGKVLYVWLDAPIGYITATMEWCEQNGQDWRDWWQDPRGRPHPLHRQGQHRLSLHHLPHPAQGARGLQPPDQRAGQRVHEPRRRQDQHVAELGGLGDRVPRGLPEGSDAMRYVLTAIMPEQKDSEFTWSDFRDKVNNELADVLGNFVNRVLVLTRKYYDGAVPAAPADEALDATDRALLETLAAAPAKVGDLIARHRYKEAQLEAMNVARLGNKYLTEQEPWKLQKTDPARTATIMHLTCQVVGNCAVLLEPFLPQTAAKIAAAFGVSNARWKDAPTDLVSAGTVLGDLPILFSKIDDDTVAAQVAKLGQKGDSSDSSTRDLMPTKDEITFDDFTKLDFRVGTVLECEKVPKADKLLKLTVDTGLDTRTVVSGIAEHFAPEEVVGRQVTLLINLAPSQTARHREPRHGFDGQHRRWRVALRHP